MPLFSQAFTMKRVVFRADGSSSLGMGHIMRCLAFATGLAQWGVKATFVTRGYSPKVAELIRTNGAAVNEISPDATLEEDVGLTRKAANQERANVIVMDLCNRPAVAEPAQLDHYHKLLAQGYFTIGITTEGKAWLPTDLVLSPYAGSSIPGSGVKGGQEMLLGPSYCILRPEFIAAAEAKRDIDENGNKVLVMVGGSDHLHLTSKIVAGLSALSKPGLSLRVVIGSGYSEDLRKEVAELLQEFPGKPQCLEHGSDLAQAMLWADLAITGDGLTMYETAATGTPSIILSRFDSNKSVNNDFERMGSAIHLGDGTLVPAKVMAREVKHVLEDAGLRRSMSQRGKSFVDGKGLERIMAYIPESALKAY